MTLAVNQARPNWGDDVDDDDDVDMAYDMVIIHPEDAGTSNKNNTDEASVDNASNGPRFRISYTKHSSTYAKTLYDVEGHVLVDERNVPVNVFSRTMKEMLERGELICFHSPGRPGHRYFVTHKKQGEDFRRAKKRGYSSFSSPYHIYEDEAGTILPFEGKYPTTY